METNRRQQRTAALLRFRGDLSRVEQALSEQGGKLRDKKAPDMSGTKKTLEEAELESTDAFVRMKHSKDFDKFKKEVLSDGRILYTYDNGSVIYCYEFTEI
jgi:hypothetical protein